VGAVWQGPTGPFCLKRSPGRASLGGRSLAWIELSESLRVSVQAETPAPPGIRHQVDLLMRLRIFKPFLAPITCPRRNMLRPARLVNLIRRSLDSRCGPNTSIAYALAAQRRRSRCGCRTSCGSGIGARCVPCLYGRSSGSRITLCRGSAFPCGGPLLIVLLLLLERRQTRRRNLPSICLGGNDAVDSSQ